MKADELGAKEILNGLRWKADMLVTNHDGVRVWLKPYVDRETGKRIGITDCCFEREPCPRHLAIQDWNRGCR